MTKKNSALIVIKGNHFRNPKTTQYYCRRNFKSYKLHLVNYEFYKAISMQYNTITFFVDDINEQNVHTLSDVMKEAEIRYSDGYKKLLCIEDIIKGKDLESYNSSKEVESKLTNSMQIDPDVLHHKVQTRANGETVVFINPTLTKEHGWNENNIKEYVEYLRELYPKATVLNPLKHHTPNFKARNND